MKGACVVLAHPRTGSSLLMQTLSILGMPWVGSHHREDLPVEANPKGYLEDRALLVQGLTGANLARLGALDGHALKLSLSDMVAPGRMAQWRLLEAEGARLLIPFRHPLESAASSRVFDPGMAEPRGFFLAVARSLHDYAREYRALATILTGEVPGLLPRTMLVPHGLHLDDPGGFVEAIRVHAGLPHDPARQAAAVGNIESGLYRFRAPGMPEAHRGWYERTPARQVYEILRASPRPWDDILRLAAGR